MFELLQLVYLHLYCFPVMLQVSVVHQDQRTEVALLVGAHPFIASVHPEVGE